MTTTLTKRRAFRGGPVSWYGGKANFLGRLRPLVPHARIYCEPFGGAASLLFGREPDPVEVYNDIDGRLVNLFRALQDPRRFRRLRRRLRQTLYSREEFVTALEALDSDDPDTAAWAFFVAQNQAVAAMPRSQGNWARAFVSKRGMGQKPSAWITKVGRLNDYRARVMRVHIDHRPGVEVLRYWDRPDTVFYVDPPYVHSTRRLKGRGNSHKYLFEMTDLAHAELVDALLALEGAAVVSGYDHPLYCPLVKAGWERQEFGTFAMATRLGRNSTVRPPRTEVVWRNHHAVELSAINKEV